MHIEVQNQKQPHPRNSRWFLHPFNLAGVLSKSPFNFSSWLLIKFKRNKETSEEPRPRLWFKTMGSFDLNLNIDKKRTTVFASFRGLLRIIRYPRPEPKINCCIIVNGCGASSAQFNSINQIPMMSGTVWTAFQDFYIELCIKEKFLIFSKQ